MELLEGATSLSIAAKRYPPTLYGSFSIQLEADNKVEKGEDEYTPA